MQQPIKFLLYSFFLCLVGCKEETKAYGAPNKFSTTLNNFFSGNSNKISTVLNLIENSYVDSINTKSIVEKTIPELLKEGFYVYIFCHTLIVIFYL